VRSFKQLSDVGTSFTPPPQELNAEQLAARAAELGPSWESCLPEGGIDGATLALALE